jgi:REP element-mobilizing transposase RayT
MVTGATYQKEPFFRSAARLTLLSEALLRLCKAYKWKLEARAVFPNHYHFITTAKLAATLPRFISHLHTAMAAEINRHDDAPGPRVWLQYWGTQLTYQRSYLARLNYVHCSCAPGEDASPLRAEQLEGSHCVKPFGFCTYRKRGGGECLRLTCAGRQPRPIFTSLPATHRFPLSFCMHAFTQSPTVFRFNCKLSTVDSTSHGFS